MPSPEVIDLTLSDNEIQPDPIRSDRIFTYGTLLDVLWQMYHAWITYGTVRRIA